MIRNDKNIRRGRFTARALCAALALMLMLTLFASCALADHAPPLSDDLFLRARQATGYIASGEYERIVTLLPFSGLAPSASEWESFSRNYGDLTNIQQLYAVGYWTGSLWKVAVPMQIPDRDSVEVLVLTSEDGQTFSGYCYAKWLQVQAEYAFCDRVVWNEEYVGNTAMVFVDGSF